MKKILVAIVFCCLTLMAQAGIVKYCMSYSDFVNDNWIPVEELTQGRTKRACQLKSLDNHYYFRTGDKAADKVLKKEAFAVMYGDQLYVNCRNLRNNGVRLDVSGYTQAVRYDKDKVCVMAYKIDDGSFFLGIGLDVASVFVDNKAAKVGLEAAAIGTMIGNEFLSKTVCYLVDNDADAKGKFAVTRINLRVRGSITTSRITDGSEEPRPLKRDLMTGYKSSIYSKNPDIVVVLFSPLFSDV